MAVTGEYGEIYYVKETDEGTVVKHLKIVDFQVSQLNRIEEKLDKLLDLMKDKELVRIDEGTFNANSFDIVNSSH